MEHTHLIYQLGVAILIGLLIGLQREFVYGHEKSEEDELFGGARTFALVALVGFLSAFSAEKLDSPLGYLIVIAAVCVMIIISYVISARKGNIGLTTEIAALITLLIGAACYWDELSFAATIGVLTAILLSLKIRTRSLVKNLTSEDIYATLKFAFISIIILPLLPRTGVGPAPFDIIVPFNVWLMVVFISGISFLGYALIKIIGVQKGIGLTGLLGGLASSTAVTMSFAQRSRTVTGFAHPFALAIMLSWTVMIIRVAVEIITINPILMQQMWVPIAIVVAGCLAYSGYLFYVQTDMKQDAGENLTNPFEMRPAFMFGLLYACVLLGSNLALQYYGNAGLYISSVLSGLVDVDAITLSMARLSQPDTGTLEMTTAGRAIILAVVSNTLVKGGIVVFTGSADLRKVIVPGILLISLLAIGSAFLLT